MLAQKYSLAVTEMQERSVLREHDLGGQSQNFPFCFFHSSAPPAGAVALRKLSGLAARFPNGLRPLLGALSLRFPK